MMVDPVSVELMGTAMVYFDSPAHTAGVTVNMVRSLGMAVRNCCMAADPD
jgi:hypothetical protein